MVTQVRVEVVLVDPNTHVLRDILDERPPGKEPGLHLVRKSGTNRRNTVNSDGLLVHEELQPVLIVLIVPAQPLQDGHPDPLGDIQKPMEIPDVIQGVRQDLEGHDRPIPGFLLHVIQGLRHATTSSVPAEQTAVRRELEHGQGHAPELVVLPDDAHRHALVRQSLHLLDGGTPRVRGHQDPALPVHQAEQNLRRLEPVVVTTVLDGQHSSTS